MGAVTVITSGKGGVGKSTVCAGLGQALARRRRRVLLIDGDAGLRSLDRMLALDDRLVFDISDVAAGSCEPIRAIYDCGMPGLYLMPAPYREENLVPPQLMRQLVPILSRYYDHVLIDCPAGLGAGFESAAAAAQRALIVATPDPLCLRGSDKVRLLLTQSGIASQRLVVNRFRYRNFVKSGLFQDLDNVIDSAGIRLIGIVPEDPETAAAFTGGRKASPHYTAMQAFDRLAARLEGEAVPLARLERL
jgi:septum site-determining protein MinD